ncbi:MAG: GIY-YIG nuclease family protein [Thiocapsa sp. N5-Cardenillas]
MRPQMLAPARLWSRAEVLASPSPVPREPGVYAWYFRDVPPGVPTADCHRCGDLTLLYIGIAPKAPPKNGARPSTQRLVDRVRYHYRGNAEGSTLRLTLGCLLSETLGIELRRVGSGKRMTFADGEIALSGWMAENAFVTWFVDPVPWVLEESLIAGLSLPLNLDMNRGHVFAEILRDVRSRAKGRAREMPAVGFGNANRGNLWRFRNGGSRGA